MATLLINDLCVTEELDGKAMAAVRGGMYKGMPSYWQPQVSVAQNDFAFDASQLLAQTQNTTVNNGNNVAFASGITANVNPSQNSKNNIRFGY